MTKMTYAEQLKHPNWQRRRLEMLSMAQWHCTACETGDVMLHVHHKRYVKGRMAWDYSDDELLVLCEECHQHEHTAEKLLQDVVVGSDLSGYGSAGQVHTAAAGLLAGYIRSSVSGEIDDAIYARAVEVAEPWVDIGAIGASISLLTAAQLKEFGLFLLRCHQESGFPMSDEVKFKVEWWTRENNSAFDSDA